MPHCAPPNRLLPALAEAPAVSPASIKFAAEVTKIPGTLLKSESWSIKLQPMAPFAVANASPLVIEPNSGLRIPKTKISDSDPGLSRMVKRALFCPMRLVLLTRILAGVKVAETVGGAGILAIGVPLIKRSRLPVVVVNR